MHRVLAKNIYFGASLFHDVENPKAQALRRNFFRGNDTSSTLVHLITDDQLRTYREGSQLLGMIHVGFHGDGP